MERILGKWEAKATQLLDAGEDTKAEVAMDLAAKKKLDRGRAERRLVAAQDALAGVPTDALLDFANALQEAIRGRVDPAGTMAQINEALREMFECSSSTRTLQDLSRAGDGSPAAS